MMTKNLIYLIDFCIKSVFTTEHVKLFKIPGFPGFLFKTPGFSTFFVKVSQISGYFA